MLDECVIIHKDHCVNNDIILLVTKELWAIIVEGIHSSMSIHKVEDY